MASQAYYDWKADGSPKRFSRPITMIANRLRAHGYTVYQEGNLAHLTHQPPEDHTFFSATGWPSRSPYPYCNAMDVMPPTAGQKSALTGARLPSLQQLSAQLFKDKQAGHSGVAFLKYMNSEPEGEHTGPCWHDSWTPGHSRIASGDRGHIHASGRSDSVTSTLSDDYDLVAQVMGDDMPLTGPDLDAVEERARAGTAAFFGDANYAALNPTAPLSQQQRFARDSMRNVVGGPVDQGVLLAAIASDNVDTSALAAALLPGLASAVGAQVTTALQPLIDAGATTPEEIKAATEAGVRNILGSLDNA
jgi:hypothetical protein